MLRRSLAWLLYSPARFALSGGVVLGLALALFLTTRASGDHVSASTTAARAGEGHGRVTHVPGAVVTRQETADPRAQAEARRVLRHFLTCYVRSPGRSAARRPLQHWTTPTLWRGLRVAARSDYPRGPVRTVRPRLAGAYAAEYVVTLQSDRRVLVDLVLTTSGWRVCDVEAGARP